MDLHPGNVMLTAYGPFVIDWSNGCAGEAGADVAMAYLIMASSDVDGLPWWLTPVARGLRRVFPSRFRAAVRDDPRPHLARVARFQLKDPNVRPADATRLRRLAGLAAAEPGAARACRRRTGRPETAPRSRKPFVIMGMWPIQVR